MQLQVLPKNSPKGGSMIYLIPGLGYNHRIFEKLDFGDQKSSCLQWIDPKQNETIQAYALRLAEPILEAEEPVVLIGHSFGGIIAQEIAAQIPIQKVILLGSIKSKDELPLQFKMVKWFRLWNFFTKKMTLQSVKYWGPDHGFETDEEIALFKDMIGSCPEPFLKWALKKLVYWQGIKLPKETELIQIHGTLDKTFPFREIKNPSAIIEAGSHIFLYKRPEKLMTILNQFVK